MWPKSQPVDRLTSAVGQQGRRNTLQVPDAGSFDAVVHLVTLETDANGNDMGGAVWPKPTPRTGFVYRAWYRRPERGVLIELFVRATSRRLAQMKVREFLPKARFFR